MQIKLLWIYHRVQVMTFLCWRHSIMIVDFHKVETVCFNIIYLLSSFAMKEILSFIAFLIRHSIALLFKYFTNRVAGNCQTCYH
jgi:hypothetical protein